MDTRTSRGEARHRFRHARRSVILLLTATVGVLAARQLRDARGHAGGSRVSPLARTQRPGSTSSGRHVRPPSSLTSWNTVRGPYGWRHKRSRFAEGGCSGPRQDVGPFWDFTIARRAHDYGYDLVRFGVANRRDADALLLPRHDVVLWPPSPDPAGRVSYGRRFDPFGSRDRRRRFRVRATSHPDHVTSTNRAHGPVRGGWRTASARTAFAAAAS